MKLQIDKVKISIPDSKTITINGCEVDTHFMTIKKPIEDALYKVIQDISKLRQDCERLEVDASIQETLDWIDGPLHNILNIIENN